MIYTSGVYQPGAPLAYGADFHAAFLNDWLRFAGFTDVVEIRWPPTVLTATRDTDKTRRPAARRRGRQLLLTTNSHP